MNHPAKKFSKTILIAALPLMFLAGIVGMAGEASAATVNFSNIEIIPRKDISVVVRYDTDIAATGRIEYGLTDYPHLT